MSHVARRQHISQAVLNAALHEVREVYAEVTKRSLPRSCIKRTQCCHFRQTGCTPLLTKGEALLAAAGVRASGRTAIKQHPDGACPLLDKDGRCTIYLNRPFGCRTHFCAAAGGIYPRKHITDLIHRLEALDEKLGGAGSRPLEPAVASALCEI